MESVNAIEDSNRTADIWTDCCPRSFYKLVIIGCLCFRLVNASCVEYILVVACPMSSDDLSAEC